MAMLDSMFDFLPALKDNIRTFADQLAKLRGQIEERKQRHEYLQSAPRHPEDLADLADELIAANGAAWPERLRVQLEPLQRKPLREVDPKQAFPLLGITGKPDTIANLGHLEAALAALFGDEIRRAVRERILSWDATGCGPRLAERQRELAQLDTEIEALEERERELVDEARKAGIRL